MSMRFRRSKKIAPGLKLNFGKKGVSLTAGGKLGRMTFGSSGTSVSSSIPGTGVYFSKKINSSEKKKGKLVSVGASEELRSIINSGADVLNPDTGRKYSATQLNAMLRRFERQEELEHNQSKVEAEENAYYNTINISNNTLEIPDDKYWKCQLEKREFPKSNFTKSKPIRNVIEKLIKDKVFEENSLPAFDWTLIPAVLFLMFALVFFLNKYNIYALASTVCFIAFFIYFIKRIQEERQTKVSELNQVINSETEKEFKKQQEEWEEEKSHHNYEMVRLEKEHNKAEELRLKEARLLLNGDNSIIRKILEEEFQSIDMPFETEIAFEILDSENVFLDVDLPEIEDCITTQIKSVLKSGKLKEKNKPLKQQKEEYARLVTGFAFYLASYVYNLCPTVKNVTISGYTQRINKSVGNIEDQYIYSIKINKSEFLKINFISADPIQAFDNFEVKWNITKSYDMRKTEPFIMESI